MKVLLFRLSNRALSDLATPILNRVLRSSLGQLRDLDIQLGYESAQGLQYISATLPPPRLEPFRDPKFLPFVEISEMVERTLFRASTLRILALEPASQPAKLKRLRAPGVPNSLLRELRGLRYLMPASDRAAEWVDSGGFQNGVEVTLSFRAELLFEHRDGNEVDISRQNEITQRDLPRQSLRVNVVIDVNFALLLRQLRVSNDGIFFLQAVPVSFQVQGGTESLITLVPTILNEPETSSLYPARRLLEQLMQTLHAYSVVVGPYRDVVLNGLRINDPRLLEPTSGEIQRRYIEAGETAALVAAAQRAQYDGALEMYQPVPPNQRSVPEGEPLSLNPLSPMLIGQDDVVLGAGLRLLEAPDPAQSYVELALQFAPAAQTYNRPQPRYDRRLILDGHDDPTILRRLIESQDILANRVRTEDFWRGFWAATWSPRPQGVELGVSADVLISQLNSLFPDVLVPALGGAVPGATIRAYGTRLVPGQSGLQFLTTFKVELGSSNAATRLVDLLIDDDVQFRSHAVAMSEQDLWRNYRDAARSREDWETFPVVRSGRAEGVYLELDLTIRINPLGLPVLGLVALVALVAVVLFVLVGFIATALVTALTVLSAPLWPALIAEGEASRWFELLQRLGGLEAISETATRVGGAASAGASAAGGLSPAITSAATSIADSIRTQLQSVYRDVGARVVTDVNASRIHIKVVIAIAHPDRVLRASLGLENLNLPGFMPQLSFGSGPGSTALMMLGLSPPSSEAVREARARLPRPFFRVNMGGFYVDRDRVVTLRIQFRNLDPDLPIVVYRVETDSVHMARLMLQCEVRYRSGRFDGASLNGPVDFVDLGERFVERPSDTPRELAEHAASMSIHVGVPPVNSEDEVGLTELQLRLPFAQYFAATADLGALSPFERGPVRLMFYATSQEESVVVLRSPFLSEEERRSAIPVPGIPEVQPIFQSGHRSRF
ncbi:MAG: hypothetical protein JNK72_05580 [Myxococcales bacterium]|nr:hypothetical protein [Myxococcales bacterium]